MHPATTTPSPSAPRAPDGLPRKGEDLIKEYRELVYSIAYQIRRAYKMPHDVDDLFVHGCAGLLDAARRFKPGRGAIFKSFAFPRIRGAILDALRREGWQSRRHYTSYREQSRDIETMAAALAPHHPDAAPLLIGQEIDQIEAPPSADLDDAVDVRSAIQRLPDPEREVIARYYLLDHTMQQIGDALGLSKGWVSKLHARGLELLKGALPDHGQSDPGEDNP
jgi:RNA polymerase sigma factor for flagellar operon FliA